MPLPDAALWGELSPLLDELLGLGTAARAARLAEVRRGDEALGASLASLLGGERRMRASLFLAGDMSTHDAVTSSLVDRQVGAYVIEAMLGEGATGTVWRARRANGGPASWAAIKLLHLSLIGRAGALRFKREGRILARVAHPNIARLLDTGVTEDGQPFLLLELVEGARIDEHCDSNRMGVRARVELFIQVLAAVTHAHDRFVVHRDIKPGNVHVTRGGQVKLLDFGIAKLLTTEPGNAPITVEGLRVLTPQYAAPEQLNGGAITSATDIYALGILLYYLLTGRHPTSASTASSADAIRSALRQPPMGMAEALAREQDGESLFQDAAKRGTVPSRLRSEVQGDLENIVATALRKNPADRYQTAAAFADDLRHYLASEPVQAKPDSWTRRLRKFTRRHRRAARVLSLATIMAASGLAGAVVQHWLAHPLPVQHYLP